MFSFWTIYLWINVRQYITKNKQYKKRKITETMYPMNTRGGDQWRFRSPICHYNGISLWLGAIIIMIKIMHRFKWWSCMLLTQYSKHLILVSQYSAPTMIIDWQNNKGRGKEASRVHQMKGIKVIFRGDTEICLNLARVSVFWEGGGFLFSPRCTHSTQIKPVPVLQYLNAELVHTCKSHSKTPIQPSLSHHNW